MFVGQWEAAEQFEAARVGARPALQQRAASLRDPVFADDAIGVSRVAPQESRSARASLG
jgi:hypothetical protein